MSPDEQLSYELNEMIDAIETPEGDVAVALERGRGLRRRRTLRTVSLVAASVALILGGGVVVQQLVSGHGREPGNEAPVGRPDSATIEQLVSACRSGNQSLVATDAVFGPGAPQVRAQETVAESAALILLSADGQHWADCFVNLYDGAEFRAGMTVYEAEMQPGTRQSGVGYSTSFACRYRDPDRPCDSVVVKYVDRVAEPVAAVELTTADGITTRVTALDGFVLFVHQGLVPDGYPKVFGDFGIPTPWILRVTYLDSAGQPLAASNWGQGKEKVEGLPTIKAYPSRRSSQPIGQQPSDWAS